MIFEVGWDEKIRVGAGMFDRISIGVGVEGSVSISRNYGVGSHQSEECV
jgi:hypothetical protein